MVNSKRYVLGVINAQAKHFLSVSWRNGLSDMLKNALEFPGLKRGELSYS